MASGDKFTPPAFKHSFVDVSAHAPDIRGGAQTASNVAFGAGTVAMAATPGGPRARAFAGFKAFAIAGAGSVLEQSAGYFQSGKPRQLWAGAQQNQLAFDERRGKS